MATNGSFVESLAAAGTQVAPDIVYTVPDRVEYTEYVDAEASAKKIKKESVTWSGSLLSETMPASFEITYTYDFGAGGVEETSDRYPLQRMLYIKLS